MLYFIPVFTLAVGMLVGGILGEVQGSATTQLDPEAASKIVQVAPNGEVSISIPIGSLDIEE